MKVWDRIKTYRVISLILETLKSFKADNCSLLAAAIAYNLLFSIFPFVLAMISAAGFLLEDPNFQEQLINAIGNLVPVFARDALEKSLQDVINARTETSISATLALIWSASSFFNALRKSLDRAWGISTGVSWLKGRTIAIAMLFGSFILMLLYEWLSTGVRIIHNTHYHSEYFTFLNSTAVSSTLFTLASTLLAFILVLLLYRYVPSNKAEWTDVWPGALLATISMEMVRFGFIWYIGNVNKYDLIYGSIGTVIAFLALIYLQAWSLLFFAEMSTANLRLKQNAPR